eukprot:1036865-Alexandrium_andersonii.AAC.1
MVFVGRRRCLGEDLESPRAARPRSVAVYKRQGRPKPEHIVAGVVDEGQGLGNEAADRAAKRSSLAVGDHRALVDWRFARVDIMVDLPLKVARAQAIVLESADKRVNDPARRARIAQARKKARVRLSAPPGLVFAFPRRVRLLRQGWVARAG